MAAYRVHSGGMWPSLGPICQVLEIIKVLDHVDAQLGFKHKQQISDVKAIWYYQLAVIAFRLRKWIKAMGFLLKYFWLSGFQGVKLFAGSWPQARSLHMPTPTLSNRLR